MPLSEHFLPVERPRPSTDLTGDPTRQMAITEHRAFGIRWEMYRLLERFQSLPSESGFLSLVKSYGGRHAFVGSVKVRNGLTLYGLFDEESGERHRPQFIRPRASWHFASMAKDYRRVLGGKEPEGLAPIVGRPSRSFLDWLRRKDPYREFKYEIDEMLEVKSPRPLDYNHRGIESYEPYVATHEVGGATLHLRFETFNEERPYHIWMSRESKEERLILDERGEEFFTREAYRPEGAYRVVLDAHGGVIEATAPTGHGERLERFAREAPERLEALLAHPTRM